VRRAKSAARAEQPTTNYNKESVTRILLMFCRQRPVVAAGCVGAGIPYTIRSWLPGDSNNSGMTSNSCRMSSVVHSRGADAVADGNPPFPEFLRIKNGLEPRVPDDRALHPGITASARCCQDHAERFEFVSTGSTITALASDYAIAGGADLTITELGRTQVSSRERLFDETAAAFMNSRRLRAAEILNLYWLLADERFVERIAIGEIAQQP
jgi:hypothetical protein